MAPPILFHGWLLVVLEIENPPLDETTARFFRGWRSGLSRGPRLQVAVRARHGRSGSNGLREAHAQASSNDKIGALGGSWALTGWRPSCSD